MKVGAVGTVFLSLVNSLLRMQIIDFQRNRFSKFEISDTISIFMYSRLNRPSIGN